MKKYLVAPLSLLLVFTGCTSTQTAAPAIESPVAEAPDTGRGLVSAADPRAAAAGQEILRQGGSAADAAMAMMLALTVVEPQSSGIGGGGFLLHHDAASGLIETIDGREVAPASADSALFLDADGNPMGFREAVPGGKSVGVPGNMRLMAKTHEKWGRLDWAVLFAPAIRLAEQGYTVSPSLHSRLKLLEKLWPRFPEAQALYWENGAPKPVGATVRNPALGKFLRQLSSQGPDAFYSGDNARAIIEAVGNAPTNAVEMTPADLAGYEAKERDAVCMDYREYRVCGMGPPSSGATTVLQMLGMLKPFEMKEMGKDDPQSWHLISEAMQLAYADRDAYLGDADFVDVPVEALLNPDYLAWRSALISPDKARADYPAGDPPGAAPRTAAASSEVPGTTHFVAVDSTGDIVSMTSTIEGPFGSQLIANGYFLNNELTDFTFAPEKDGAPVANRVEAGKRPLSSMSPTIVYDANGQPVLALGSAGGKRIIMHVAKTLIGYIDFGLPVDQAIALPNIYFGGDAVLVEQGGFLEEMAPEISKFGRTVVASDLGSKVNAAARGADGWIGAADPRSEGVALSE